MAADVRQAVDHAERLIDALLVLARTDQTRTFTDALDLAAIAEHALEGRAADHVTTTTTLHEAPVTGDGVLLERLIACRSATPPSPRRGLPPEHGFRPPHRPASRERRRTRRRRAARRRVMPLTEAPDGELE
jgi:hypothetical protein